MTFPLSRKFFTNDDSNNPNVYEHLQKQRFFKICCRQHIILHIIAQFLELLWQILQRKNASLQISIFLHKRGEAANLIRKCFFFYFQDLRDDTFVSNDTKNIPRQNQIAKECGNSEVLKLKLHLNSEIYRQEVFKDFGKKKGGIFLSFTRKSLVLHTLVQYFFFFTTTQTGKTFKNILLTTVGPRLSG